MCLSTETVEVLYALGEETRIAGISGFTVRPARRAEETEGQRFLERTDRSHPRRRAGPVLAFSDLQADICRDLAGPASRCISSINAMSTAFSR